LHGNPWMALTSGTVKAGSAGRDTTPHGLLLVLMTPPYATCSSCANSASLNCCHLCGPATSRLEHVANGAMVFAFDMEPDGSLTNRRELGKLRGAVMAVTALPLISRAAVYVATGRSVTSSRPTAFVGSIPGPERLQGAFFGGREKRKRSLASCFTADRERRTREAVSSRFRRLHRVIPGKRSCCSDSPASQSVDRRRVWAA
jgi:hypothetical protein